MGWHDKEIQFGNGDNNNATGLTCNAKNPIAAGERQQQVAPNNGRHLCLFVLVSCLSLPFAGSLKEREIT